MNHRDEPFSPENVDEQIDQFLQKPQQQEQANISPAQMVHMLQDIYEEDPRLQRVWERLADHLPTTHLTGEMGEKQPLTDERFSQTSSPTIVRFPQEKVVGMQTQTRISVRSHKRGSLQRSLGLLVAVLIMALLVGSLVAVLQFAHQKPSGQTGASQQGAKHGQIVYSTPQENGWATGLAWSADSQRVAVAMGNNAGEQIEIWDATTGQHKVTVPLNLDPIANPAWSPTSDLLAVPTNDAVVIVDGKTGKIGTRYPAPSTGHLSTTATTPSTGSTPLITFSPLGGGPHFGGIAWSPDGKWIVSTFSSDTWAGLVQVWNPQTGKLAFTLATRPDYFMGAVSWSPDGQYIAVNMAKWNDSTRQIDVWSMKTHQVVFQQSGNLEGLSWQPGTDNLAAANIIPGSNSSLPGTPTPTYGTAILKIWNVTTKQLLKSFPGVGRIAWSPNGQEFAYSNVGSAPSKTASVTVLDVNSGQKVYSYQESNPAMDAAWSPDGRYLVSAESDASPASGQQSYIVQVRVA
jgi:Tol biopolymer transport system component